MKLHNIFIALIALAIAITSCSEDYLDRAPVTATTEEEVFSDSTKTDVFINGIYDEFSYWYYTGHLLMIADVRGEDALIKSSGNYGRLVEDYQYAIPETYYLADDFWQFAYILIANVNSAISEVEASETFSAYYKNRAASELRAIRAKAYMDLVKLYGHAYSHDPNAPGVPVFTETIGPNEDAPGRMPVQDAYDQIINDLEYAVENMPAGGDIYHINKSAAQGMLARAYLRMENWGEAAANAAAARTGYPLMSGEDLLAGFADPTTEWMWALDMREDDNNGYLMLPSFYDTRVLGYSSIRATPEFVELYGQNDLRRQWFSGEDDHGVLITKYLHRTAWDMDQVLMRASEMYLIEAEAYARLENTDDALTALNAVQERANAQITPSDVDQEQLINAVKRERRKELFGEGFRVFDLMRWNDPLVRTSDKHWAPVNLPANDPLFLYPIPQEEINANSNISEADQNAAYK